LGDGPGKQLKVRMARGYSFSAYAPHQPIGVWSVGAKRRDYFNTMHRNEKPKEAFWQDLKNFLRHWKTTGEYMILVIDVNYDVRSKSIWNDMEEYFQGCTIEDNCQFIMYTSLWI
jgi:hypothetical protein